MDATVGEQQGAEYTFIETDEHEIAEGADADRPGFAGEQSGLAEVPAGPIRPMMLLPRPSRSRIISASPIAIMSKTSLTRPAGTRIPFRHDWTRQTSLKVVSSGH